MKLTLHKILEGPDEVIIRYHNKNAEVDRLIQYINQGEKKLTGILNKEEYKISPEEVLYLESVDNVTYLYTSEKVYRTNCTLAEAAVLFCENGYFRCSKSMVINIYRIKCLKSEAGNRIDATMENGEHVMISRRYSRELRLILKEDRS